MAIQLRNSQLLRVLLIGFLILLLQIPVVTLQQLVSDRQLVRAEAITDITSKWGNQQTVIGPRLIIPYIKRLGTEEKLSTQVLYGTFLPEDLQIASKLDPEVRYRGIFEVPVYKTDVMLSGNFLRPDFTLWGIEPKDILWDQAELTIQISDTRAIQNQAVLGWNQTQIAFEPGLGKLGGTGSGIHASLRNQMGLANFNFSIPLKLNGSQTLQFVPLGKVTQVTMSSTWNNPSFQGLWLPTERSITEQGFNATWSIPSLGRNYPQQWNNETSIDELTIEASAFGVDLLSPVDNYRKTDRSIKYNFLFLGLTFVTLWLFELTAGLTIHPLQYLLVGAAMCLFYLLQLALSEHIGFHYAYAIASFSVVILITTYCFAVLGAKQRGGIVGVLQVVLYSYLYVVLANQDYSLLLGSIGLFLFLAVIMYCTRRIDRFDSDRPVSVIATPPLPPKSD
jgi:inner membrane protein